MREVTRAMLEEGLEPYNAEAVCKKCGYTDIASTYQEGCNDYQGCDRHPERIDRLCRRCRFEWAELPLTKKERV